MESANEGIRPKTSASPLSSSSSDPLQAAPESEGIGDTGPNDTASTGKGLIPETPASSTASPLKVDVGNSLATSDNGLATNPSPTGSFLSASYTDEDLLAGSSTSRADEQPNSASGDLSLGNDPATQSPPTQVMERPSEPASASGYRIPDYVFARKPSTAPVEWSAASNDSLFSIQMGNMSFTREQISYLSKSGELGLPGELNMSGPYIDFSSNQPPDKQVEISQNGGSLGEGPCPRVTEAKAVETMREVIMECAENDSKASPSLQWENNSRGSPPSPADKGIPSPRVQNHTVSPSLTDNKFHSPSCLSHASNGSTKSFAFPILAGSEDRSSSLKIDGLGKQKQYSPRGQPRQNQNSSQREVGSQAQTPKEGSTPNAAASQAPKSVLSTIKHKWLSCFSCCSCFN